MDLDWQVDAELRALADFAVDADPTTVLLDDLFHDRQPQPGPALLRGEERFKDPIARGLIHSLAMVRDCDARVTAWRLPIAV